MGYAGGHQRSVLSTLLLQGLHFMEKGKGPESKQLCLSPGAHQLGSTVPYGCLGVAGPPVSSSLLGFCSLKITGIFYSQIKNDDHF